MPRAVRRQPSDAVERSPTVGITWPPAWGAGEAPTDKDGHRPCIGIMLATEPGQPHLQPIS